MSEHLPSPDADLVASARAGDRDAREALGRKVGRSAYVFALQLTRDREAAGDVAQDSVLKFFKNLDRFDVTRPVEPWLYQITRNRVRDLARRQQHRRHQSLEDWIDQGRPDRAESAASAAADAERADLQRRIWRSVSLLSDDHREIFVLRDFHGLSYREIADVLSIPPGTVMSRLHSARTNLRSLLSEHLDTDQETPPATAQEPHQERKQP
ncbi:MAG: RNA polymerase sigma factor [Acidimicrobiia bacterium]|nr:RNA polymerase sigma factor [Acidimicrobiia bacterium]